MSYEHPRAWIDDGYMWLRRDQQDATAYDDEGEEEEEVFCRWCQMPVGDQDTCTDPRCIAAEARTRRAAR